MKPLDVYVTRELVDLSLIVTSQPKVIRLFELADIQIWY